MQNLEVHCFTDQLNETNMYILEAKGTGSAVLIDPSDGKAARCCLEKKALRLDYIILTHEHYDHIVSLKEMQAYSGAKVVASKNCSDRIQDPSKNISKYFHVILAFKEKDAPLPENGDKIEPYYANPADIVFEDAMTLDWQGHRITLREAPGHSPGSILADIDGTHLFSGDTLSYEYELVTALPGGNRAAYEAVTEPVLRCFAKETLVYPGHGRVFSMEEISAF